MPAAPGAYGHPPRPPDEAVGRDPEGERGRDVGERGAARVVIMERDAIGRQTREHRLEHPRHQSWMRGADGVADRHVENAEIGQRLLGLRQRIGVGTSPDAVSGGEFKELAASA